MSINNLDTEKKLTAWVEWVTVGGASLDVLRYGELTDAERADIARACEWVEDYGAWCANVQDDCTESQWAASSVLGRWDVLVDLTSGRRRDVMRHAREAWLRRWVDEAASDGLLHVGLRWQGRRVYARGGARMTVGGLVRRACKRGERMGNNGVTAWALLD